MPENPPNKKPLTVCATHGLRYDPELDSGCVLCRKMQAQQEPAAKSGNKHWPMALALLALLVSGGLVFRAVKKAREAAALAREAAAHLPDPSKTADIPILAPPPVKPDTPETDPYEGVPPSAAGRLSDANIGDMYTAVINGSGIAVQRMLAKGADINKKLAVGETPLAAAIAHDQESLAIWMLTKGADAKASSVLALALKHKMSRIIGPLLDLGVDPNDPGPNKYGDKPIQLAIDNGDIEAADALATHGAKLDVTDAEKHSLLARACGSRDRRSVHMLQWVIDHLPSRSELEIVPRRITNINEEYRIPPIVFATNQYNVDNTRLMILNGANYRGTFSDYSLLTGVAQTRGGVGGREVEQRDTIHLLIDMGADAAVAIREMDENPVWNDYEPWAEHDFIKKAAVSPPAKTGFSYIDQGGNTHLHWAAALGEPGLIKRLIDRDMDLQLISQGPGPLALTYDAGASPLQLSAAFGHPAAVEALLKAGAQANVVDTKGRSPTDVACTKESARYAITYNSEIREARCARVKALLAAAH